MVRVYADLGCSQAFYRIDKDLKISFSSLEDFLIAFWEGFLIYKDANNLLALLWTWQFVDISDNEVFGGDFEKGIAAIICRAIVMPGRINLYFPPEDNKYEVSKMPNAELRVFESIYGYFASSALNADDVKFQNDAFNGILASRTDPGIDNLASQKTGLRNGWLGSSPPGSKPSFKLFVESMSGAVWAESKLQPPDTSTNAAQIGGGRCRSGGYDQRG